MKHKDKSLVQILKSRLKNKYWLKLLKLLNSNYLLILTKHRTLGKSFELCGNFIV
jgi:hypothetical protein